MDGLHLKRRHFESASGERQAHKNLGMCSLSSSPALSPLQALRPVPTRTLNLTNFAAVPFGDFVRRKMETAFAALIGSNELRIDFTGSTRDSPYQLSFQTGYAWTPVNRDRNWYRPGIAGVTGQVNIEALRRRNFCRDVGDQQTCEPVVRELAHELGYSIAYTANHEAGHLFGLVSGGPDGSGHSSDPRNYMFVNSLHAEYAPYLLDHRRTTKYRIRQGDNLSRIAQRIGFCPPLATWTTLYDFKGQDGRRNRDLLRSRDPNLIYPGEEIWIPDIPARLAYMRSLELCDKQFNSLQIATMRSFLASGRTVVEINP